VAPRSRTKLLVAVIDLYGGTGAFCRSLLRGLKDQFPGEFETSLLLMRDAWMRPDDADLADQISLIGREVHDDWRRFPETLTHALRLRRALSRCRADVVFSISTFMNLLVPLVAPQFRTILSAHTHLTSQLQGRRFSGILGELVRLGYPRRLVVVPCQGAADDLRDHFGARRTQVIYHGVDAPLINRLAEAPTADLPTAGPYIVAVGRLWDQKDYPTMIRAYAIAAQRGLAEHLVIVGEGPHEMMLAGLARELGVGDRVHLIGRRANPYPYMKRARFFVLSSIWEGFGLVVLEAMALGLPCISTDCPSGPAEILSGGEHGLLVPVKDPEALAAAMLRLSGSAQLRETLAHRSLARAAQLTLGRMVATYRDLFTGTPVQRDARVADSI
jgi:glycosyltransferase involved in cell wall biosynthesis